MIINITVDKLKKRPNMGHGEESSIIKISWRYGVDLNLRSSIQQFVVLQNIYNSFKDSTVLLA